MTVQVYNEGPKWHDSVLEEFAAILTPFDLSDLDETCRNTVVVR